MRVAISSQLPATAKNSARALMDWAGWDNARENSACNDIYNLCFRAGEMALGNYGADPVRGATAADSTGRIWAWLGFRRMCG
ncbi:hypothetical protein GCM10017655_08960 [Pseudomonas turukhanskensis]|uniref:Uncharacterized protein n=1 Tax=Pseudomonas turukhanskensis TaxID=1806536 RepID=A0A9W6NDP6_9PSED|nr:hypothetical protein GCM10017655_08960 [Pseudomonas turukhanskensis]